MAAGIAAVAVGLSVSASYEERLAALARESAALQADVDRERQIVAILRDPSTEIVAWRASSLRPRPGPGCSGTSTGRRSPGCRRPAVQTPAGKTYQLWAIAGKNPPVSAGVFGVDAKGTGGLRVAPLSGVGKVDVFAVTLEPAGGLPAPSGEMYLAGKS